MTPDSLERHALAHTRDLIELASCRLGVKLPQPEVRFDLRGKAAGVAVFPTMGSSIIRYNPAMLAQNGMVFIRQTVPHEVAHLVARRLYGRHIRPHGAEWRSIMALFGVEPTRCHNFPVTDVRQRRMRYYSYRCTCRVHRLSAIRHNRSQRGVAYLCRHCGSSLSWVPALEC